MPDPQRARVLLLDNYDSFTFNLVQALRVLGAEVIVRTNDELSVRRALELRPTHVLISPGPGTPERAGISMPLIEAVLGRYPLLGVCLGHQALAAVLGGTVGRAERIVHGKAERVYCDGRGFLRGLPNPFEAGRYHSLIVREAGLPDELEVSAWTREGEIMGLRHRSLPAEGVQFHPESVLTPHGPRILERFLATPGPGAAGSTPQTASLSESRP